jgi:dsRNA-specific ribonuclease
MKQSVVNNMALSLIALYFNFDELVITEDAAFLKKIAELKDRWEYYYENMDKYYEIESSYIKVLGDLFEAFVGALFIDTHFNFYLVKHILNRMIYEKFINVFSSTEYLEKLPEMKMRNMLKERGITNPRLFKREKKDFDGRSEFALLGDDGTELCSIFAMNQKQALNEICRVYLQQNLN